MTWVIGHKLQNGKYTIEKEIGKGGFGITYLARNDDGQRVVIKTLNDTVQSRPDFDELQQDFLNEAVQLAKCTHPHIVKINKVVQEGRLWCMVMEYIDGEDLANRVIKQGVLPEAEALRYIQQIGEALTVVHNQGLLHRDVKPQNIMLRSGKLEAVLIDFGIAREFTQDVTQTHTEYRTEFFAPIEQYDRREKRGAYTDVYALAATLYVILTAKFPQPSPLRAAGTPLTPPKQHNSSISDNVNRAILKGMALKAKDRPQSVAKWLKLLPSPSISTPKKSSPRGKLKNKLLVGGAVLGLIGGGLLYCQVQFNSNPISLLISSFSLKTTLTGHSNSVNSVAFSPDGQTLASGSGDKTIKIWDIRSGKLKTTLTGDSKRYFTSVALSSDGQTLASGSKVISINQEIMNSTDYAINIWDVRTGKLKTNLTGHSKTVNSVAFSPNGQTLASGSNDETIKLWDVSTGKVKTTLTGHSGWVNSVAFSPDGQTLASVSNDETIKIWDIRSGKVKTTLLLTEQVEGVYHVAFSPDGQILASENIGTIQLWDVRTGKLKSNLTGHSDSVNSVAFSPDGQTLASGSSDKTIKIWDIRSGQLKSNLTGHSDWVNSVAFSPDGQTLASGSADNTIKLWRISP